MFYCEACRVANQWPKGMSKSVGPCEMCGITRHCYDRPSSSLPKYREVRQISLLPLVGGLHDSFKMEDLLDQQHFRVVAVVSKSPRRVVLDYAKGDLADPATDPLIIGTIRFNDDYSVRVLWDGKLWRPWDPDTDEAMGILEGIKPGNVEDFLQKLKRA